MSKNQYRILLNGEQIGGIRDSITNEEWSEIIDKFEARYSGKITLQERFVTEDKSFWETLVDKTGYLKLKDKIISPWITKAEVEVR